METKRVSISTMMTTKETGPGTAVYKLTGNGFMAFVSGQPCETCVNAEFTKDRHSICEFMLNKIYKSQSANDARSANYGDSHYWDYLEQTAAEHFAKGIKDAFTKTLAEALRGNDGL